MTLDMRRLMAADAEALRALRVEAFTAHPREFRSTPEDEAARPLAELAANLARDQVLGLFDGETLVGVAGLAIEPRALKLADGTYVDELAMVRRCSSDEASEAALGRIKGHQKPLTSGFKFDQEEANSR